MILTDLNMKGNSYSLNNLELLKIFEQRFNPDEEYLGTNKEINKITPLVSVFITTYQHRSFIRDCLESVLIQKTTFPFEILIGEDESTDGTREICIEYAERYPNRIRLFLRDRKTSQLYDKNGNYNYRFNAKWLRKSARGKYIASCEGDDYWTDPMKLQKQSKFLESNKDYILTSGGYQTLDEKTGEKKEVIKKVNPSIAEKEYGYSFTLKEASKVWITKTLTLMYRNHEFSNLKLLQYRYSRDLHFIYHLLQEGKGFYFTEIFGVYRLHAGGVFSPKSDREKAILRFRVHRELYLKNGENNSRVMYFMAITNLLKNHRSYLSKKNSEFSLTQLYLRLIKLIRTTGEFKTFIKILLLPLNTKRC